MAHLKLLARAGQPSNLSPSRSSTEFSTEAAQLLQHGANHAQFLQRKSRVKRRFCGKAYEYRPLLTREKAVREAIGDRVDRRLGGSGEALLISLVTTRQLDPKKLADLKKALDEHDDSERGGRR